MKVTYKEFEINAIYKGDKAATWNKNNFNRHIVYVKNKTTGAKTSFEFWASIANPTLETEYDVLNAFYCFVSDALSGLNSFEDFCGEFGYDTDSMSAYKTFNACKRAYKKFEKIEDSETDDIYNFVNELSDIAG